METVGVELGMLAQTRNLSTWKAEEYKVKARQTRQSTNISELYDGRSIVKLVFNNFHAQFERLTSSQRTSLVKWLPGMGMKP